MDKSPHSDHRPDNPDGFDINDAPTLGSEDVTIDGPASPAPAQQPDIQSKSEPNHEDDLWQDEHVSDAEAQRLPPGAPRRIGHYRILRVIGAGGMGAVYLAMQDNPRRAVALKIIKAGVTSPDALRRFLWESQILGRLRHTGIAQIYEAGQHDDGTGSVPYFAMEFVAGAQPLTNYADKEDLSINDRVKLFMKACDAIHYGHQKGIIHRDLKPGNILVDNAGDLKIIDFGVARSTDADIATTTMQTNVGQLVGTVQYMSPEQCDANPDDIDVRSDVYGLAVVLYQLLTGEHPYKLQGVPIFEATRIICEESPIRPTQFADALPRDLETIILKAMEKDRNRRYQSALEFEQDLKRYLDREPITARPQSTLYKFRLFTRRNKVIVASAAAILLVLIAGIVISVSFAVSEAEQRKTAEASLKRSNSIQQFLANSLKAGDPDRAGTTEISAQNLIDDMAVRAGDTFRDDPETLAELRDLIGDGYFALGKYNLAQPQYEDAVRIREQEIGDEGLAIAGSWRRLAETTRAMGHADQALAIHERALKRASELINQSKETNDLKLLSEALLARGDILQQISFCYRTLGFFDAALEAAQKSIMDFEKLESLPGDLIAQMSPSRQDDLREFTTNAPLESAISLRKLRRSEEAIAQYKNAYAKHGALFPDRPYPGKAIILQSWALALRDLKQFDAARGKLDEVIDIYLKAGLGGQPAPRLGSARSTLSSILWGHAQSLESQTPEMIQQRNQLVQDAVQQEQEALSIRMAVYGTESPNHRLIETCHRKLAMFYEDQQMWEDALREMTKMRDIYAATISPEDTNYWYKAWAESRMGEVLLELEQYEQAEPLLLGSYTVLKATTDVDQEEIDRALRRIIDMYERSGNETSAAHYQRMLNTTN